MDSGSKKEQPRLAKVEKGDGYQGKSAGPYGYCGRSDSRQRDFESSGLEHRPVLEIYFLSELKNLLGELDRRVSPTIGDKGGNPKRAEADEYHQVSVPLTHSPLTPSLSSYQSRVISQSTYPKMLSPPLAFSYPPPTLVPPLGYPQFTTTINLGPNFSVYRSSRNLRDLIKRIRIMEDRIMWERIMEDRIMWERIMWERIMGDRIMWGRNSKLMHYGMHSSKGNDLHVFLQRSLQKIHLVNVEAWRMSKGRNSRPPPQLSSAGMSGISEKSTVFSSSKSMNLIY